MIEATTTIPPDDAIGRRSFLRAVVSCEVPQWLRITLRIVTPVGLFFALFNPGYLIPTRAPRMLVGDDWTMYIVSPNYLRDSPLVSVPIAELPNYLSPFGSNLGRTDSIPILGPVYRLLIAFDPDQPMQLVGWILLAGVVVTFFVFADFLDSVRADWPSAAREVITLVLTSLVILAPFWRLQYVHPALMQAWILIAALAGALRRCPTALNGRLTPPKSKWVGVAPVCAAAAIQPYLLPMAFLPAFAPDLALARIEPRRVLTKIGITVALVVSILLVSGFLGSSGSLGADGFGEYAGDISALVDPNDRSRFVADIPTRPGAIGGFAYVGLGALVLFIVALVEARRSRSNERSTGDPAPLRCVWLAVGLLTLYAVLPAIRLFDHEIIDFTPITRHFDSLTALFRTNGRFVWPLVWLLVMMAAATAMAARRRAVMMSVVAIALLVQIADVIPYPDLMRDESVVDYDQAKQILEHERGSGMQGLQFQPPIVIPGCYDVSIPFYTAGDVLLAASVLRLPINSGHQTRVDPEIVRHTCVDQAAAFQNGKFSREVGYVIPAGGMTPTALSCQPLTRSFTLCRFPGTSPATG
jgi:Family of unknown function (DUF6311)